MSDITFLPSLSFVIVPSVTPSSKACCKSFDAWILLSLTLSTLSLTLNTLFLMSLFLAAYSDVNLVKSASYWFSDIKPSSSLACKSIKSLFNFSWFVTLLVAGFIMLNRIFSNSFLYSSVNEPSSFLIFCVDSSATLVKTSDIFWSACFIFNWKPSLDIW